MKSWIPFSKLDRNAWIRLGTLAVAVFYIIQIGFEIHQNRMLRGLGVDYLAFWSAGKVADTQGYRDIYALEIIGSTELAQLKAFGVTSSDFATIPVPLLSLFIIPFQFLSRINIKISYWIWGFGSLVIFAIYTNYFLRKLLGKVITTIPEVLILMLVLVSFPSNQNFYYGQVEMLLVISAGEFIRNAVEDKPFLAGIWLSGLLLKPQLLIIVVPALILLANWKSLSGFITSSIAITGFSLALSGFEGMKLMIGLWTKYLPGIATNAPENMMNFRMLGIHLNDLFLPPVGWVLAGAGILLTILIVILMIRKQPVFGSESWVMTMFGIFTATCAVTWHSHNHMAMVLIPFLIFAIVHNKLEDCLLLEWVLIPPVVLLAVFFLGAIMILGGFSIISGYGGFIMGLCGLAMNILLTAKVSQLLLNR